MSPRTNETARKVMPMTRLVRPRRKLLQLCDVNLDQLAVRWYRIAGRLTRLRRGLSH